MAAGEQLQDQLDHPGLAVRSIGVKDMPRKSHSMRGAAVDERQPVVRARGSESACPMTTRAGSAPASSRIVELAEPDARHDGVGRDGEAGPPRARAPPRGGPAPRWA